MQVKFFRQVVWANARRGVWTRKGESGASSPECRGARWECVEISVIDGRHSIDHLCALLRQGRVGTHRIDYFPGEVEVAQPYGKLMRLLLPPLAALCRLGWLWLPQCRLGTGWSLFPKSVSHRSSTTSELNLPVFNEELKQLSGFIHGVLIVIVIGLGDDDQKWGMISSVCCTFGDRDRAIKRGHRTNPFIHGEGAK